MKKYITGLLALLTAASLASCTGNQNSSSESSGQTGNSVSESQDKENSGASEAVSGYEEQNAGNGIALIDIRTNSDSPDVMDFVTKPVARYVAEDIASWTKGYVIPPEPYYEACTVTVTDKDGNELISSAGANVKVRGNWTTTYDKKPLRIKFDEKQSMLGLNDGAEQKNWVLVAAYKDGSLLRDKTALDISREILGQDGLYSSDCQLAEVVINGQYWGMYLLAEQQQVSGSRLDITQPEKDYTGTDIGYFLEYDGYFRNEDDLHSFHISYNDNAPLVPFDGQDGGGVTVTCMDKNKSDIGFTIKSDIYSQEQHDFIENFVDGVYCIMYEAAYNDKAFVFNEDFSEIKQSEELTPQEAVEKVVNVDSLADMYIISELTCDADLYWSSFFMDADFGGEGDKRLTFEAPWDFDSSMGNRPRCADGSGFYAASLIPDVNETYETVNPWLTVLIYQDWFQDIIREKWTASYDSGIFEKAAAQITEDAGTYSSAFDRNYQRWNNIADKSAFVGELSKDSAHCLTHQQAADYLADWLTKRVDFMNSYWHT